MAAPFYDDFFLHRASRTERERPFFNAIISNAFSAPPRVLVDACGGGVHAGMLSPLAEHITACDVDEDALAYARTHVPLTNGEYVLRGYTERYKRAQFNLIVNAGNALSFLSDTASLTNAFRVAYETLTEKGVFIAHIANMTRLAEGAPVSAFKTASFEERTYYAVKTRVRSGTRAYITLTYFRDTGEDVRNTLYALRVFTKEDMLCAATDAGFTRVMGFGAFSHATALSDESGDIVLVCAKGDVTLPSPATDAR